ncbi:MAG: alpha/beta fold hydrolase [Solirubrobacterales bacterium]
MPRAQTNGIELEYEAFGDASKPTVLLTMGLGIQLLGWDERFCNMLADRGFHVVRFDNRDVGLSSKIEGGGTPNVLEIFMSGNTAAAPYSLEDMAEDTAGLLDHLGVDAAHVVGLSMGGMIAQTLACRHPDRVLSLTSIMSTTGDRAVGQPRPDIFALLAGPAPGDREGFIDYQFNVFSQIGSPKYPLDEQEFKALIGAMYDRSHYPAGFLRQLAAILASADRTPGLGSVKVPTLVIHGEEDPLIALSGGEATAAAVPGSKLIKFPGMGHDLPPELWPQFIDAIVENTERAGAPAGAAGV